MSWKLLTPQHQVERGCSLATWRLLSDAVSSSAIRKRRPAGLVFSGGSYSYAGLGLRHGTAYSVVGRTWLKHGDALLSQRR